MEFSAKQIASFIQGEIIGDENATVHTFAKIEEGVPGAISFLSNPKYTSYIYDTQASIVLVNRDFEPEQEIKATLIKVDNAYESLAKLLSLYEQSKPKKTGIHPLAYVDEQAKIGNDVYIGPFAYIGAGTVIGDHDTVILTGGSMMYVDAICKGIDDIPTVDNETRELMLRRYETEGLEPLCAELKLLDPEYYKVVDLKNPKRVVHV